MNPLRTLLRDLVSIESALENLGRTVLLRSLQPGLPAEAVQEALAAIGFTAPTDGGVLVGVALFVELW